MSTFTKIEQKLQQFSKKFYLNELIKGSILFISLGLLYFFFTLFIEYFLWLQPVYRTLLFWIFIIVEIVLLVRFICFPIFKIFGLKNGISPEDASKIIGNHFPEVKDKLLNILQLKQENNQSDLLIASIEQKSNELQPIPFSKAIHFSSNKKYIKYALVPLCIWLLSFFTGFNKKLNHSFERIVNHSTAYTPPAPFYFFITTPNLQAIQGKPLTVYIETKGEVLPNDVKINFDNQSYFMQQEGVGLFSYTFNSVTQPITFFASANGLQSTNYTVTVIKTPSIQNVLLELLYPAYTGKKKAVVKNSGNTIVPQGTFVKWKVKTTETETVTFISNEKKISFSVLEDNLFEYQKKITDPIQYQISTSNQYLKDYDNLQFTIDVIKDEHPQIEVTSDIDSISRGNAQFAGRISDDYGFKKLELVYYNSNQPEIILTKTITIGKESVQTFFYQFPNGLSLQEGINYELFFQVFDNDAVNGSKKAISRKFTYKQKTVEEIEQELLNEQKSYIDDLENSLQNQQKNKKALEKVQFDIQNKKNMNWNDQKKIQNLLKRQEQYQQMMQRQTEKIQKNLEEKPIENENLQNKKDDLQKRINELKELEKQQKLLEELQKLAEKLNKDDLLKKAKELAAQNKQQERSLERILELTKRFYVEQKTMQLADQLEKLANKQEELANKENNNQNKTEEQSKIEEEFNKVKEELEELKKDNEKLKDPMDIPSMEDLQKEAQNQLNQAKEKLEKNQSSNAKENQKKAAEKMKQMSQKMQDSMQSMSAEMEEENMEGLRQVLKNLVTFSFDQEALMNTFSGSTSAHPNFGKNLQKQHQLKTYFEHIDDSLFVLSMKNPRISSKVQNHLADAHYNLDQSLENFADNNFRNGLSNQQYVMTAANSLADMLSNTLDEMQNPKPGSGKGKGKGESFSLPDIIQKQEELTQKMKEGVQKKNQGTPKEGEKGEQKGDGKSKGKDGEQQNDLDGELYQIYKEQSELREQLENVIKEGKDGNGDAKKALKQMEQLENEILEKGFTQETINRMQQLNYELLKLDKATFEQNKDKQRKSNTNLSNFENNNTKEIQFKKLFYNQTEILNRQSLPLRQNYKKKVQEYFNTPKSKE